MSAQILEIGTSAVGYSPQEDQCFGGQVAGLEMIFHSRYTVAKYLLKNGEQEKSFMGYQVFTKNDLKEGGLELWWPAKFAAEAEYYKVNPQVAIEGIKQVLTKDE